MKNMTQPDLVAFIQQATRDWFKSKDPRPEADFIADRLIENGLVKIKVN